MAHECIFNGNGVSPECCDGRICVAQIGEVEQCCGKIASEVPSQTLVETYLRVQKHKIAPEGAFITLLKTIAEVEKQKQGTRLL